MAETIQNENNAASGVAADQAPVQLFRVRDYIQQGVHFAAYAATVVAVGFWVGPVALAVNAGIAGVVVIGSSALMESLLPRMFKKRELALDDKMGLSSAIDDFTARAGLPQKPTLHDFEFDKEKAEKVAKEGSPTMVPQMQRIINAAAAGLRRPIVIISQPLLQLLRPPETRAVIAHEFAHLGAQHTRLKMGVNWLQMTVMGAAFSGAGSVVVASMGWPLTLLSIAGVIGIGVMGNKILKDQEHYTKDGTPTPKTQRIKLAVLAAQETLSIGLMAIASPVAVLTALAIEHGFFWTSNLLMGSHSRRLEFQADRGAVALGANPLDLITGLRKMEETIVRDEPAVAAARDWHKGSLPSRMLKMAESLFKSHPDTQRRCKRLAKIAKKQGYGAEEITTALTGAVDISALPPKVQERAEQPLDKVEAAKAFSEAGAKQTPPLQAPTRSPENVENPPHP